MAQAPPHPAIALPPSITFDSIALDTKPTARLECSQVQAEGDSGYADVLVVFLNGLVAPQGPWLPVIALILRHLGASASKPQMLAYDRFGQGRTIDRDPSDQEEGKEEGYGHDILDIVRDLRQLISQVTRERGSRSPKRIVFVANSIGCAIARLYAQEYPGTVAGMLLLDTILANSDFVSVFPDPDGPDFDAGSLPEGVTSADLRETRAKCRAIFHPSVKNAEGLDRRSLPTLLPEADRPSLEYKGFGGRAPFVTVVGHDPDHFARETLLGLKIPIAITMNYLNPAWHRYNEDLTKLTDTGKASGPIIAKDCGHFIQKDNPVFVAELASKLLGDVVRD